MDGRGNPDAIFWIALSLALGAVLLAVALGPRGGEEVRLGNKPENPPQEDRAAPGSLAPEGSDSSGQPAPQDSSGQPAPGDSSLTPTDTTTDTVTAPTDTVVTDTRPVVDRVPSRIMEAPEEHLVEPD